MRTPLIPKTWCSNFHPCSSMICSRPCWLRLIKLMHHWIAKGTMGNLPSSRCTHSGKCLAGTSMALKAMRRSSTALKLYMSGIRTSNWGRSRCYKISPPAAKFPFISPRIDWEALSAMRRWCIILEEFNNGERAVNTWESIWSIVAQ